MKELDPQHLFYDSPYPEDIIERFDSEIAMFRANKP
jgi:hypothetical protein